MCVHILCNLLSINKRSVTLKEAAFAAFRSLVFPFRSYDQGDSYFPPLRIVHGCSYLMFSGLLDFVPVGKVDGEAAMNVLIKLSIEMKQAFV